MINYNFNEYCCGCAGCHNLCPAHAIEMKPDKAGFLFPHIDKEKCTDCGLCERICPHLNAAGYRQKQATRVWLYASADEEAKKKSASGAAFYELAKGTINDEGIVFGCAWNSSLKAKHCYADRLEDLVKMQGSKYVQSDMHDSYSQMLQFLKKGKSVLFSGTPCQASAAHNIVMAYQNGKYRKHLLTVGVLCHGVSAPEVWESCKRWMSKQEGSPLIDVNFRDKSQEGYKKSYCKFQYASGHTTYLPTFLPSSTYIEATLVYNLALRNSCHHCDCKGITKACDLIIGDWYAAHEGTGKMGTSCVIAFTEQGKTTAERYLQGLQSFDYKRILESNAFIEKSVPKSPRRDEFIERFNDDIWNDIESFYPAKYGLKKFLVRHGLFNAAAKVKNIIKIVLLRLGLFEAVKRGLR